MQTSVVYKRSRSIQFKEAWHTCYKHIHQEWDLHLACLGSACASTHRIHHMRPCAHHHQLESHICNLQPNLQSPLQSSKSVSALAVGLQIHAPTRKNVSVDQLLCVKTGTSCSRITVCNWSTVQEVHYACQGSVANHVLLAKSSCPTALMVALLQRHARADLHVSTLNIDPEHSFMGQTCMSQPHTQTLNTVSWGRCACLNPKH